MGNLQCVCIFCPVVSSPSSRVFGNRPSSPAHVLVPRALVHVLLLVQESRNTMTEVRTVTNLAEEVATVTSSDAPRIGVLALQGGFHEHMVMLSKLGANVSEVRQVHDLEAELDGLVVPGGESTTMGHLAERLGLLEPLRDFVASGRPVMGTCAGLIFLAKDVLGQKESGQELVGGMDVSVQRNFFGSQAAPRAACRPTACRVPHAACRVPPRAELSHVLRPGRLIRDDADRNLRPGALDPRDVHPRACDHT